MTAEVQDCITSDGVGYALVGSDGTGRFDPGDHGVEFAPPWRYERVVVLIPDDGRLARALER